jgi:large subunit ribosomal protein L10
MVQPKPKRITREEKEEIVDQTREKIEENSVIGILDMQNLPARQLQEIKGDLSDSADVTMVRKTLMEIAVENAEKEGIEDLLDADAIQPALIFSEESPFRLFQLIDDNKTSAAAQGGEIAPDSIEIPEGDTGIGPGPMLGKLQQFGADVQVQDGSIHVQSPATMLEQGEKIEGDAVEILNQLGIEPLEIGLDLKAAYSDTTVYDKQDLDIDVESYAQDLETGVSQAFNLSVNAAFPTETTAQAIISEAASKAQSVSVSQGLPTEKIDESLGLAASKAEALEAEVDQ